MTLLILGLALWWAAHLFKRLAPASMRIPDWQAQESFARQLIDIRKFKKAIFDKLAEIEKLPAALLREAFTGAT